MTWLILLTLSFLNFSNPAIAVVEELTDEEYQALRQMRNQGGSGGVGGSGCLQSLLQGTSQGISNTLAAQNNEANAMMGISKQYMELEQQCGNDLAEITMQLNQAEADHEEKLMMLPAEIDLQKIEYEEALLAVNQECEASSGQVFMEWKQMVSDGVVTPERGGPMALFSRGQNINRYQKLFYDDCLASKNNVKRVDLLAKKLNANIKMLQAGIDASAMKLASLSENLSFKQGMVVENCMRAEDQLDYQAQLARSMASATNSAARTNNFLGMISTVAVCMGGPGNAMDTTVNGASSSATN